MSKNQTILKESTHEQPDDKGLHAETCSRYSDTPETDAFEANQHPSCRFPAVLEMMRKLERERNKWRSEHDRIRDECQHRLILVARSAIASVNYPENDQKHGTPS